MAMPGAWRKMAPAVTAKTMDGIARLGLSPRQQEMNRRWARYCCSTYDGRKVGFDGLQHADPIEKEVIASQGFIPPGFVDASGDSLPVSFRRPSMPYYLDRAIVDRFTGALFAEGRHPKFRAIGDADTEDYANALADASRLWARFIGTRNYGGATGSVAVGFVFKNGKPFVENHDPRWCVPEFLDRATCELSSIEKRYQFPKEVRDPETGLWKTEWWWYRRIIDVTSDIVFNPEPVREHEEPRWVEQTHVDHGLEECPAVWIQNVDVDDDIDGEPDCLAAMDIIDRMSVHLSMADRGTVFNADPSFLITTDSDIGSVQKGSKTAIKLGLGSDAKYVEISGTGPAASRELVQEARAYALELCKCVLESPEDSLNKTATAVRAAQKAMDAQIDILREQYGQNGVLRLMGKMLRAVRKLGKPRVDANGVKVFALSLPPRIDENGVAVQRKLGTSEHIDLQWPPHSQPTAEETTAVVTATNAAKTGGLIDIEHAAKKVAPYFGVEDVNAMLEKLAQEKAEAMEQMQSDLMGAIPGRPPQRQLPPHEEPDGDEGE